MAQLSSAQDPSAMDRSPFGVDFDLTSNNVRQLEADLFLDINLFSEYVPHKIFGTVEIGFRRIQLELILTGSIMPLKSRNLIAALPPKFTQQRTISHGEELSTSFGTDIGLDAKPHPEIKSKIKEEASQKTSTQVDDQFTMSECTVYAAGYDFNPTWRFEEKQGKGVLSGGFKKQKLGVLQITDSLCTVGAEFTVMERDMIVSGVSGLFPSNMNKSHRAVRQILIWGWLKKKVKPYLSRKYFEVK